MKNNVSEKSCLLLLARRFPFNHGEVAAESYLESEIRYLSEYFDEIVAIGTEAPCNDVPTCVLPSNVTSIALGCGNSWRDKLKFAVSGLLPPRDADVQLKEAIASDPVKGLTKRVFRGYFAARALDKYKTVRQVFGKLGFVPTHVYSFWLYDTALVASWVSQKFSCGCAVARAHGYDLYADRSCVHYLPFRKYLLSSLDKVFPCSKDGTDYINAMWPGFKDKVSTLYLGTRPLPDKSEEDGNGPLKLVSCSRVVDVKRVNLIADAIAVLERRGVSISWTHFGDGPLMGDLESACKRLTTSKVDLKGNIPNRELLASYEADHFDLFVNVSSSEGLPISIMEACGIGIPVLATDVGGTHEIVNESVNGFLLDEKCSATDIANGIERFIELGPVDKKSMRRASRVMWEQGFQTKENVKLLVRSLGISAER